MSTAHHWWLDLFIIEYATVECQQFLIANFEISRKDLKCLLSRIAYLNASRICSVNTSKNVIKFNDLQSKVNNFVQQIWSWSFWYKNAEFKSKKIQHRVSSDPMDTCLFNKIHCWCDWYFFSIVIFECVWSLQMSHVQLIVTLLISLNNN